MKKTTLLGFILFTYASVASSVSFTHEDAKSVCVNSSTTQCAPVNKPLCNATQWSMCTDACGEYYKI